MWPEKVTSSWMSPATTTADTILRARRSITCASSTPSGLGRLLLECQCCRAASPYHGRPAKRRAISCSRRSWRSVDTAVPGCRTFGAGRGGIAPQLHHGLRASTWPAGRGGVLPPDPLLGDDWPAPTARAQQKAPRGRGAVAWSGRAGPAATRVAGVRAGTRPAGVPVAVVMAPARLPRSRVAPGQWPLALGPGWWAARWRSAVRRAMGGRTCARRAGGSSSSPAAREGRDRPCRYLG